MNGEYTKKGKELLNSFYDIIYQAGYKHIKKISMENITDQYLKANINNLNNKFEKNLLNSQSFSNLICPKEKNEPRLDSRESHKSYRTEKRRRLINNLPENCKVKMSDIPKYCRYIPKTKYRGDYFIVEHHPNLKSRTWQTTSSKYISTDVKYDELIKYLDYLDDDYSDNDNSRETKQDYSDNSREIKDEQYSDNDKNSRKTNSTYTKKSNDDSLYKSDETKNSDVESRESKYMYDEKRIDTDNDSNNDSYYSHDDNYD